MFSRPHIATWSLTDRCTSKIFKNSNIWWSIPYKGRPLACTRGCSAKKWTAAGVYSLQDLLTNKVLKPWVQVKNEFGLPQSHVRTYSIITKALKELGDYEIVDVDSNVVQDLQWHNGSSFLMLHPKDLYSMLHYSEEIRLHVNLKWHLSLSDVDFSSMLYQLWHSGVEPKKIFRWKLLLHRLPLAKDQTPICSTCRVPETIHHIFFDCLYAKEIWKLFLSDILQDGYLPHDFIAAAIRGNFLSLNKHLNIFWMHFSTEILWFLWKERNEVVFQHHHRDCTEPHMRLTLFKIFLQSQISFQATSSGKLLISTPKDRPPTSTMCCPWRRPCLLLEMPIYTVYKDFVNAVLINHDMPLISPGALCNKNLNNTVERGSLDTG